jgi:hypothetical protein
LGLAAIVPERGVVFAYVFLVSSTLLMANNILWEYTICVVGSPAREKEEGERQRKSRGEQKSQPDSFFFCETV